MTAGLIVALGLVAGTAQEKPRLSFPAQAEIILVDVVVLDDQGRPVRGLTREDFTVLEDGKAQAVVGFELRDMAAPAQAPGVPGTPPVPGTPAAAPTRGRTVALVIDDLGIAPLQVTALKQAVKRWLDTQADPRDEVTVVTSSGDLWWSDSVASGKADLLAVVERVQSKKPSQGQSDYMSDWEAYRIDSYEFATGAREASAGPPGQTAGPPTGPTPQTGFGPANLTGRVAARWAERRACFGNNCSTLVRQRAREIQDLRMRRTRAVFGTVERLSKSMAGSRGRKTIVVFSDGLIRDVQFDADERAADAAQLGNTAVSFVDTRGLGGDGAFSLDQATIAPPGEIGLMLAERELAAAGTAYIAEETGGSVVNATNDIADGLGRVVDESSAYYLLGYEPPKTPDGKWHKLEVKVSRPGVNVRARRRYFAASGPERKGAPSATPEKGAKRADGDKLPARAFDPAILTSGDDTLPVRVAPYVMEPGAGGQARVMVALEIDVAALALDTGDKRAGRLDLTLIGVSRDQPKTDLLDQRLDLELDPKNAVGWFTLSREVKLPAGVSQVRVLVRDVSTGRVGRAWSRFQVPVLSEPYLSTPVLTDKMEKQSDGTPRLVPVAHREFSPKGSLFLQYEVHGMSGNARVGGGFRFSTATGEVITAAERTPITPAGDGRLVRILGFPLEGLREGEYQIVLDVLDETSGKRLAARLPFRLGSAAP